MSDAEAAVPGYVEAAVPADAEAAVPADAGPWSDALLAAQIFAVDPAGTGVSLHACAGPVRDAWLGCLRGLLPAEAPVRRTPSGIGDAALLGGLDLAATLQAGRPVSQRGLLAEADGGVILLAMAERLPAGTAARLTGAMDTGQVVTARDGAESETPTQFGVVALDEGEDEQPAPALLDRLAIWLDLRPVGVRDAGASAIGRQTIADARARLAAVDVPDAAIAALCKAAAALGIAELRPCLLATRAARAHAALAGRTAATLEDAAVAARLVLAPRATRLPQDEPASETPPEPTPPEPSQGEPASGEDQDRQAEGGTPPADIVLAAARAAIPANLLSRLQTPEKRRQSARSPGKLGASTKGFRGRPAGVRASKPRGGERLNLIETLRAAAPWQPLRRAEAADAPGRILLRTQDFRVTILEQKARTTTIFVVDASGSSAFNRLAEAKGAVELLLADCYRRRDEVAVLAFRGKAAALLLPPTRSLVRAKRSLAGLPGGGGTPLAAGLRAAAELGELVRRGGFTPTLVFLTDGRGNIALDGTAVRTRAEQDAEHAARRIRGSGLRAILVDTSPRPVAAARTLSQHMGALYLPLPTANATGLSRGVKAALGARQ